MDYRLTELMAKIGQRNWKAVQSALDGVSFNQVTVAAILVAIALMALLIRRSRRSWEARLKAMELERDEAWKMYDSEVQWRLSGESMMKKELARQKHETRALRAQLEQLETTAA
jgi:hypothetical protein